MNHPSALFYAHVQGLEHFTGKVLEIGGTDEDNLREFFREAEYHCVRLEENKENTPWILPQRDFREIRDATYDLIISLGVFEEFGLDQSSDRKEDRRSWYQRNDKDLQKLFNLTRSGGMNIIGTISDPCLYTDEEIGGARFTLIHRISLFFDIGARTLGRRSYDKTSELVVMGK